MKISEIKEICKKKGWKEPNNDFFTWYRANVEDYTKNTRYIEYIKRIISEQIFGVNEKQNYGTNKKN